MKHTAVAALLAFLTLVASAPATAGAMMGAHIGSGKDPNSKADFAALETVLGRKLAIDNDHEDWANFPNAERVRWDAENGRMSMLSWRIVFDRGHTEKGCATADAIMAGTYDAQLRRQALAAKALGRPVLVRFNYEMTNNEENTCFTGFDVKSNLAVAGSKYVAVWRRVVDTFRAAGATNVKWVWAPGHRTFNQPFWRQFYPGDAYVDWIGVDYYNKTDTLQTFGDDPGMRAFVALASMGKPLMIAETGSVNDPHLNPDPQTVWLRTARDFVKAHPAIKAFVWWGAPGRYVKQNPGYGGSGYVLQGSGLAAFKAMADDPYFK
jgi:beta-mannanase